MENHDEMFGDDVLFDDQGLLNRVKEALNELWSHRELLYFLVWKNIKVKYKQTSLGVAWAVLQPLLGMILFTILFGKIAKLPSDGLPYPVFYYAALLPWTYFSSTLSLSSNSVLGNAHVITKVYFPRILLPASHVFSTLIDLMIASILLIFICILYGVKFTMAIMFIPGILAILLILTLGMGAFLAALTVDYRDIQHALPFVIQVWMFSSPVVYPMSMIPEKYQLLYAINPIAGIIETNRALIAGRVIPWDTLGISCVVIAAILVLGLWYFRRTERRFADVI